MGKTRQSRGNKICFRNLIQVFGIETALT